MFAYLKGALTYKSPTYLIVETGGIGYQVFVSLNTYTDMQDKEQAKLYTHYHVTESAHTLFGFSTEQEKELFELLISVSGVGPATARLALSYITPAELKAAILQENVSILQRVKGIGAKSAQRIILELRDKIAKVQDESSESAIISAAQGNTVREEALSALVALGFNKSIAEKTIEKVLKSTKEADSVEHLIKLSLKSL